MKNIYMVAGNETLIASRNGHIILIDTEDLPIAQQIPGLWTATKDGHNRRTRYATGRTADGRRVKLHRLIMDAKQGELVDHIDTDGLNNRRANLRLVTQQQNQQNRPGANRNSKSGIRGVYYHAQRGKWIATCKSAVLKKLVWLGSFDTAEEAEAAAIAGRAEHMTHSDGVLVGA